MPSKSRLLFHRKRLINEDIIEIKIWKVEETKHFPEGIKYSIAYLKRQDGHYKRVFGYDNERGKGHHEHRVGKENKIEFQQSVQLSLGCSRRRSNLPGNLTQIEFLLLIVKKQQDDLFSDFGF